MAVTVMDTFTAIDAAVLSLYIRPHIDFLVCWHMTGTLFDKDNPALMPSTGPGAIE